ncbi:helix-turn-helix domain-containing protein [Streptomyces sp. NPDC007100]|uniref:nSTAND1 domain-containing NTPase n=1 Tax=Streptomyces sp. NPDC007100 TaxID=3155602 RepID=UPI0033F42010
MAGGVPGPGSSRDAAPISRSGRQLRRLRLERGVSLARLAELAFYSKGYLSKVENGEKALTWDLARACDEALGTGGTLELLVRPPRKAGRESRPGDQEECPYRGLAAFGPGDSCWFFGRDEATAGLVAQLTERLRHPGILMVTAPSGAGKSSLLQAGLLPALARGALPVSGCRDWPVVVCTPGEHPLENLPAEVARVTGTPRQRLVEALREGADAFATAVAAAAGAFRTAEAAAGAGTPADEADDDAGRKQLAALVLVVDQFEETFTLCRNEHERTAFVDTLLALSAARPQAGPPPALVVLGVRADFYDRCLAYPGLGAALQRGHVALGPMSEAQLREAVTGPAREAGLEIEPGLVEVLVRDAGVSPGSTAELGLARTGILPLLSHALMSTWQHRRNGVLTVAGYQLTGGIPGAVATTAERTYAALSPDRQATARRLLLHLVSLGEEHDTSRRAPRESLLGSGPEREAAQAVLEVFTQARLLTVDADHIELAHEVLLRAWPRLRQWLDEDRATLRARQLLTETASEWEREGRDESLLYRGARLNVTSGWLTDPHEKVLLTPTTRAFLTASTDRETSERRTEQRRLRRLRILAHSLAVLLVLALLAVAVAVQQSRAALEQRRIALSKELAARAETLLRDDPEQAMLTAFNAYRRAPTTQARSSLLSAYSAFSADQLGSHAGTVTDVAYSPDGRTLATAGLDRTVKLWSTATHQLTATLTGHTSGVRGLAFSPDGRILAAAGDDATVKLWDTTTHREAATLAGHARGVRSVAFSPDGRTLATAGSDRTARLWDVRSRRQAAVLSGHSGAVTHAAFSPDGSVLATAGADGTVRLWQARTHRPLATLTGHSGAVQAVAFSPDGSVLASADDTVHLWNTATHRQTGVFTARQARVAGLAFSPDSRHLAIACDDRAIRLWHTTTHRVDATLTGNSGVVHAVAFAPDGNSLAGAGGSHAPRLWELDPRQVTARICHLDSTRHWPQLSVGTPCA